MVLAFAAVPTAAKPLAASSELHLMEFTVNMRFVEPHSQFPSALDHADCAVRQASMPKGCLEPQ